MAARTNGSRQQMMLDEPMSTLVPKMALPPIIAQLITNIYNLVDTYFVSTLGTAATAAVGVNSSLEHVVSMVGCLLGAGACSYVARLLGAKRKDDADRVLSTSFFTGLGFGVFLMILCIFLLHPLVRILGATPESELYAVQYATYVLMASPFMAVTFILNMCLRSEGRSTYAMIGTATGGILNCFLDPLFIYTFGLGVAGASMATAISKFISFCILLAPYVRKTCAVSISVRKILYKASDIKEVLVIGSSSFLRTVCNIIANVLLNRVAGSYSTAALAAVSVANRVLGFPFAFFLGFGMGFQPVVGFNWGAKRPDRVRDGLRFSCIVAVVGAVAIGAILFVFAGSVVPLFNREADAEVLRLGILSVRAQCISLCFHSFDSVINMFFAGIGRGKLSLLMSTARQGYCFIPAVLILPVLFGVNGVAVCQGVADILTLVVSVPLCIKAVRTIAAYQEELQHEPRS